MSKLSETPPTYCEVETLSTRPDQGQGRRQTRHAVLLSVICCCTCLLVMSLCLSRVSLRLRNHDDDDSLVNLHMTIQLDDGVNAEQHIISSVVDNYVTYHVREPTSGQHMWILDDFERGVQVMKVETAGDETLCYMTSLNHSQATTPTAYSRRRQNADSLAPSSPVPLQWSRDGEMGKTRIQSVLMLSDVEITDRSVLGTRGNDLCPPDVPVYRVSPLNNTDSSLGVARESGRSKRSVKKCIMSCCYLVCCCNQKWLRWESDHFFNCKHVCHGCTDASFTHIEKKC